MPLHDFECTKCNHITEEIVPQDTDAVDCPKCGAQADKAYQGSAKQILSFIPDYPGCKKLRAGYVHSHGDRPSEKIQSTGWSADR